MRHIDADRLYESMQWNIQHDMYDKPFDYLAEIDAQPTADVRENVRGKWWHEPYTNNTWAQRCSNCFHVAMITVEEECPYNYCPLCGADMRGGQHD